ncbi:Phosphoserine phosphatase RsbP [Pseudobythopirellula maris]|uniref:Phosphoserine phosphatase RsbP n=1 Tax=Pseudobythopirellula maris TaxID=2527991 RepID=A0A5C5ZKI4_9BACT|nr:SpoIIE family protein phosphatase [Pseudobythopirellula maris]TWT87557.1 Phosphoserine phosphatase RsbP [Pseudobythopirellula maris]
MASLRVLTGAEPNRRYTIDAEQSVIGRSSECEVALDVAAVSRRHATILHQEGRFFAEDLGSRNGTFVNGQKIIGRTPLRSGDKLLVCDQEFVFEDEATPAGAASTEPSSGADDNLRRNPQESSLYGAGTVPKEPASSLVQMVAEDDLGEKSNVMATLDLTGRDSWSMSARPEVKLAALVEISNALMGVLSIDDVLPKLLDSLFTIFVQADRGFVIMRPEPEAPLVPVASKSRRADVEERMRISRTIVEEAVSGKRAFLSADAASDERFGMAQSIADFKIRSMMCAPMIGSEGEVLGVIQIDTLNQNHRFSDDDLEVLAAVASQAAVAVDNAQMHDRIVEQRGLERDLELAHQMQRALLPDGPPEAPGYGFFDYYDSARQVGGDYYDYVPLPDGRFAVVLGDVAGKGVAAAIIMAKLSSDVRFALATENDLATAVMRVNDSFCAQGLEDRFVTMVFAVVDPADHSMTIVNAGHMGPMLRRASGEVETIAEEVSGLPIGIMEGYEFEQERFELAACDSVTLFTDGFSEAMNEARDLYGMERLAAQVGAGCGGVADLGDHVLTDVRKFVAGFAQSDDMCLVCFGRDAE